MTERTGLYISAAGNLFMAGLGVGFALWAGSDAIMFDGFFSGVQFLMVLVNLYIAALLARGATPNFQFGYAAFEPLVITLRGSMILAGAGYAFWMAVRAVLAGGRPLSMGIGVLYAVVAALGCLVLWAGVARAARSTQSPILRTDAQAWLMDAGLSAGVALAFLVGYLLQGSRLEYLLPYLDPALVILMVLGLVSIPVRTMREGLRGLLGAAPDDDLQAKLNRRAGEILAGAHLEDSLIRMARIGRVLYALAYVYVPEDAEISGIRDLDGARDALEGALREAAKEAGVPHLEVDTVFTSNRQWLKL
jgi:predicted Co/Zn/Cd cation transporter (cation efflux family)